MNIPLSAINISEEVNKTSIWKQVNKNNTRPIEKEKKKSPIGTGRFKKKKQSKRDEKQEKAKLEKRLSIMNEEEEDDGITIKVTDTSLHI
ncbi:hypothetical protein TcasGA2_TC033054 [Tribolium castaneum]|uniref:Uncharacterized protein n=2 Tax=Tribolium castaneum TaxID=7070 RepID=A0A139WI58_TRICA|nr:hypothetical protein TcasGA2_TC033054 [Tribolium castaneum]